jgi:hypothetical protein
MLVTRTPSFTAHADFPILGRSVRMGSLPAFGSPEDGNHVEELECRMMLQLVSMWRENSDTSGHSPDDFFRVC